MRSWFTSTIELVALALIVTGVALIWIPAAFIAAGAGLLLLSYSVEKRPRR